MRSDGVDVVSVSVDVKNNRVLVGVVGKTDRKRSAVQAMSGPLVVADEKRPVIDACAIDNCANLKGGLMIKSGVECTSGYIAVRWDTDPNQIVMVTAGDAEIIMSPAPLAARP